MKWPIAIAAAFSLVALSPSSAAGPEPPDGGSGGVYTSSDRLVRHDSKVKNLKSYETLSMFLRLPASGGKARGVLCMCVLAEDPLDVPDKMNAASKAVAFADRHDFAVVAWGSKQLWDPARNWNEMAEDDAKDASRGFDCAANAWDAGIRHFVSNYGIPASGYLMTGFSGSAQYAMRLAMRHPERFLAVHLHIPSSFDNPVKKGASVLWCLTTGENEMGYERSLAFFHAARRRGYPFIYKAYPGLGHKTDARAVELGFACFEYALELSTASAEGVDAARPDWKTALSSSKSVADIFNQRVFRRLDADCIPPKFRMPLLSESIAIAWESK